jgi:Glycosyl hydrolase family 26
VAWGLRARTVEERTAREAACGRRSIRARIRADPSIRARIRADPTNAVLAAAATAVIFVALPAAIGLASVLHWTSVRAAHPAAIQGSRADCIYSANSISALQSFERLVNRQFDCALVFNNASSDWAAWEKPWFLTDQDPRYRWGTWASTPGTHRQLIITNDLFPSDVNGSDWLTAGAAGAYEGHAQALARNLVAAGLGNSVIRLAHEANDTSYPYSLADDGTDLARWRLFWRRTVLAIRSVPGAHFLFDWCINAHVRPIQLSNWYPGDDVVDIVGIDAYDAGVPAGQDRWQTIYDQSDGIRDVLAFARAHGKPVSIPEWGLWTAGPPSLGGGDDAAYVNGIASVIRSNPVAYQAYFYNLDSQILLRSSPLSLSAYRRHFGGGGDSAGAAVVSSGQ